MWRINIIQEHYCQNHILLWPQHILVLQRAIFNTNMQDAKGHYLQITMFLVMLLQIIKIIKITLSCASFTTVFKFYLLLWYNKWLLKFLYAKHGFLSLVLDSLTLVAILFKSFLQAPSSLSSIIFVTVDLPHGDVSWWT